MKKCIKNAYKEISKANSKRRMNYMSSSEYTQAILDSLEKLYNRGVGVGKTRRR